MASKSEITFDVVVDSNVFFSREVGLLASGGFTAAWTECQNLGKVALIVPEVVKGERLYQLMLVAEKSIENAKKNFETLSAVAGQPQGSIPSKEAIRNALEERFAKWLTDHNGTLESVPFASIDWKQVVNDSIWRVAPFVPAGEKKDSEKGFRDYLILETLKELHKRKRKGKLAFISDDVVLRNAAIATFDQKTFAAYENIGGLSNYLKLVQAHLSQEFIKMVTVLAPTTFFVPNQSESLFYKGGVLAEIKKRFVTPVYSKTNVATNKVEQFTAIDQIAIVQPTEFLERMPKNVYRWKTPVQYVQLLAPFGPQPLSMLCPEEMLEKLRRYTVEVTWVAAVARSGSFRNSEIVDYTLTHEKVETAWLTKQRYGFAEKSQSSPSEKSEAIKAVSYDSLERTRPWLALSRLYESSSKGPSLLEVLNINESQLMLSDLLQAPQTPQPTLLEILARSKEPEG